MAPGWTLTRLRHANHAALLSQNCALVPFNPGFVAVQQTAAYTCHNSQHWAYTRLPGMA